MSVKIDQGIFWSRLKRIFDNWNKGGRPWAGGVDAIIVNYGSQDDESEIYSRTSAIHLFLFGYEFPDTVLVFTEKKLTILCSKTKGKYFESLGKSQRGLNLELMIRNKADKDASNFATLVSMLKKSKKGTLLGWLPKETQRGKFITRWNQAWTKSGMKAENVSLGLGRVLSVKDRPAQKNVETAARFTATVFKRYMKNEIESICDEEKKVKHQKISEDTVKCFEKPQKFDAKIADKEDLDVCYDPLVMSGGLYDLRSSATNDDKYLDFGQKSVIICKLGARYKQYCSNLTRTIFIDPSTDMEKNYKTLINTYLACYKILKAGTRISQIHQVATGTIKRSNKKLIQNFVGCGFGMGLEFRESNLVLNEKNQQILKSGHIVNFSIGFEKLKEGSKTYAMQIADTILITQEGRKPAQFPLP
eukprot:304368-Amorphochlora_amoeboformis.AAC.2